MSVTSMFRTDYEPAIMLDEEVRILTICPPQLTYVIGPTLRGDFKVNAQVNEHIK
jgi:hypothetical protein